MSKDTNAAIEFDDETIDRKLFIDTYSKKNSYAAAEGGQPDRIDSWSKSEATTAVEHTRVAADAVRDGGSGKKVTESGVKGEGEALDTDNGSLESGTAWLAQKRADVKEQEMLAEEAERKAVKSTGRLTTYAIVPNVAVRDWPDGAQPSDQNDDARKNQLDSQEEDIVGYLDEIKAAAYDLRGEETRVSQREEETFQRDRASRQRDFASHQLNTASRRREDAASDREEAAMDREDEARQREEAVSDREKEADRRDSEAAAIKEATKLFMSELTVEDRQKLEGITSSAVHEYLRQHGEEALREDVASVRTRQAGMTTSGDSSFVLRDVLLGPNAAPTAHTSPSPHTGSSTSQLSGRDFLPGSPTEKPMSCHFAPILDGVRNHFVRATGGYAIEYGRRLNLQNAYPSLAHQRAALSKLPVRSAVNRHLTTTASADLGEHQQGEMGGTGVVTENSETGDEEVGQGLSATSSQGTTHESAASQVAVQHADGDGKEDAACPSNSQQSQ